MKIQFSALLLLVALQAQAQTDRVVVITDQGTSQISTQGSTVHVIQTAGTPQTAWSTGAPILIPRTSGQVFTPTGSYLVVRSGSTVSVITTGRR